MVIKCLCKSRIKSESNHFAQQKLDYIHNNPVDARLVDEPEYHVYFSARDYMGQKGVLEVVLMD